MSRTKKKMLKFQTIYDEVVKRIGHDHSTSNEELERVGIQTIGDKFLGVFASDTFPRATRHETYCIVNLDDSNGAGTHWVARMTKKRITIGTIVSLDQFRRLCLGRVESILI